MRNTPGAAPLLKTMRIRTQTALQGRRAHRFPPKRSAQCCLVIPATSRPENIRCREWPKAQFPGLLQNSRRLQLNSAFLLMPASSPQSDAVADYPGRGEREFRQKPNCARCTSQADGAHRGASHRLARCGMRRNDFRNSRSSRCHAQCLRKDQRASGFAKDPENKASSGLLPPGCWLRPRVLVAGRDGCITIAGGTRAERHTVLNHNPATAIGLDKLNPGSAPLAGSGAAPRA